jgi:hypothetical protein
VFAPCARAIERGKAGEAAVVFPLRSKAPNANLLSSRQRLHDFIFYHRDCMFWPLVA